MYFNPNGEELLRQLTQKRLLRRFNFDESYDFVKMLRRQIKGENNSWAIRWYASAFLENKLSLFPGRSLVFHNGGDNTGTNCVYESWLDVDLSESPINLRPQLPLIESIEARHAYVDFFRSLRIPIFVRIRNRLIRLFK